MAKRDFYFLDFPETNRLFNIFEKNQIEAKFVGGCVRNALFDEKSEDFDLAVNADISDVVDILKSENIKLILTGIKYGSITAMVNDVKFELTSLRKDEKCFGRRCVCARVSSFEEDAKRRDFTINALYVSKSGEMSDYFNGMEALFSKRVKFIGIPKKRIEEDYLRVFRYYRFCAKYGDLENQYADVIKSSSKRLKSLSTERIQRELFKIIESKYAIPILRNMNDSFVFSDIFGDINIDALKKAPPNIPLELKLFLLFSYDALTKIFRLNKIQKRRIAEYKNSLTFS